MNENLVDTILQILRMWKEALIYSFGRRRILEDCLAYEVFQVFLNVFGIGNVKLSNYAFGFLFQLVIHWLVTRIILENKNLKTQLDSKPTTTNEIPTVGKCYPEYAAVMLEQSLQL